MIFIKKSSVLTEIFNKRLRVKLNIVTVYNIIIDAFSGLSKINISLHVCIIITNVYMQYLNLPFSIKVMHRLKALKDLLACLKMQLRYSLHMMI